MSRILILFNRRDGDTERMAKDIFEGVQSEGVDADLKVVQETKPENLLVYQGIIMGSPCYYGSMTGDMKSFIDATVKYHGQLEGKVGSAFACSANVGGGAESTVKEIAAAMMIHGMIIQGDPLGSHFGSVVEGLSNSQSKSHCFRQGKRVAKLVKMLF